MRFSIPVMAIFAATIFAVGCADTDEKKSTGDTPAKTETDGDDNHHKSKHGGHVIDIGHNHEYHAEFVDNHETESITVYMMDKNMNPLSIDQPSISLAVTAGDSTKTFELAGKSAAGSSEFSSNDKSLMEMMHKDGATVKLRVTINGSPHTGTLEHHAHDHGDHDHDHDHDHD